MEIRDDKEIEVEEIENGKSITKKRGARFKIPRTGRQREDR